jgi:DNA-binding Lrp family transcriptional regulator
LDWVDVSLCILLQTNSRTPYHELAAKLGLSINAVHKRIRAMVDAGIIRAFTARQSLTSVEATSVWVFGRSEASAPDEIHSKLKTDDRTYWVAYSGGGYVYVGGYLRDISELESYVDFVDGEAELSDATVGIIPSLPRHLPRKELGELDLQILASLHRDSRKPASEVADEVRASAKTVHRRLERMIEDGLVDLSIDWYPDASNDIIGLAHVITGKGVDRMKIAAESRHRFPQSIIMDMPFSNLPNQLIQFLWTNSMKQMDDLRAALLKVDGVKSVTLNVLRIGYMFDTWRDRPLEKEREGLAGRG